MTNKHKFLKSAAEMYKQASEYGQLLNRRKQGIHDDFYMTTPQLQGFYKKLMKMTRDHSTISMNFARQTLYNQSFLNAITSGKSAKQAKLTAQSDVSKEFDISIRQVQRSVDVKND